MLGTMPAADLNLLALLLPLGTSLLLLLARGIRLRAALARVPVRMHVGGTRGKSSVCRLIASGLRAAGIRTLAKTTGADPLLLLPDGSVRPWLRLGPASIGEQRRFALLASRMRVQATVLECMAIRSDLVRASERDLVRATVAVITNIRPDHLEDLPSIEAIAESCLGLVPEHGVLVASEDALSAPLRTCAAKLGTAILAVPTAGLSANEANRAIARAACEAAGVPLPRLESEDAASDPGAFALSDLELQGKRFRFANAFACNDTVSLDLLWRQHATEAAPAVALLNHRGDRPLRSLQFLDYFAGLPQRPRLLLLGSTFWLRRAARRRGLEVRALSSLPWISSAALIERIALAVPEGAMVWGVGNYHGRGAAIVQALRAEAACSR
jgi:poly-gamma-glutamate synthase PgsB/CapB